jgi:Phosphate propanoyltransferase
MTQAMIDRSQIEQLVRRAIAASVNGTSVAAQGANPPGWIDGKPNLRVSISARHCHLTDEHVEILFGRGSKLEPDKDLYQDGFYAAKQTVMVVQIVKSNWPLPIRSRWGSMRRFAIVAKSTAHLAVSWLDRQAVFSSSAA